MNFCVWIDADSFPVKAKKFTVDQCASKGVKVNFVANHEIKISGKSSSLIVCQKEKNAADDYIFSHCSENDIVLTRDILFAERLVKKEITVLNDRGTSFTKDNIQDRLKEREFSLNLAEIGLGGGKDNYYGEKELKKFSSTFLEHFQKHLMASIYNIKAR